MVGDGAEALEWMAGFPPSPESIVRFADGTYYAWPQLRWAFNHMEQLVPTKTVWRGAGAARPLRSSPVGFDDLTIDVDGEGVSWGDMLTSTNTDALAVLHRGELVYEQYFGAAGPHVRHTLMSCNKSMVGLLAEGLIHDGLLDDAALVPTVVPELAATAWGDATVRQVLDMEIGLSFSEDYMDPTSDVWRFLRSTGMTPSRPDDPPTIADYLVTVDKEGEHGEAFAYREPNIFVLGWIVRRAAGRDLASLASDRVWQHIGAEHDWLYMVDDSGAETTATATLRDLVRFGQLVLDRGRVGEVEVVPSAVIDALLGGGDQDRFAKAEMDTLPGWSYRSQWWFRHTADRVCPVARGAHGQLLVVDPAHDLVIARFGSAQHAPMALLDPVLLPMVDAITAAVSGSAGAPTSR